MVAFVYNINKCEVMRKGQGDGSLLIVLIIYTIALVD